MQNKEYQNAIELKRFCRAHIEMCDDCVFYISPTFYGEQTCALNNPSQWRLKKGHIREPTKMV